MCTAELAPGSLTIVNWNVQWATERSERGKPLLRMLEDQGADVICCTETSVGFLEGLGGHVLCSDPDYGYESPPHRRKVVLWSRERWRDVDVLGSPSLPGGRFVAGSTKTPAGVVRFVGVCIPWRDAHVRTGRKDRKGWEEHEVFLEALPPILAVPTKEPVVLLGDFNQRLPRKRQPIRVFDLVERALVGLDLLTAGPIPIVQKPTIDHIAVRGRFAVEELRGIPAESDGLRLSDHFGVALRLTSKF